MLKVGWPGGKKFTKLFFAVKIWISYFVRSDSKGRGEEGGEVGRGVGWWEGGSMLMEVDRWVQECGGIQ